MTAATTVATASVRTGHGVLLSSRIRRFFRYVQFDVGSDCWLWRGTTNYKGYGNFDGKSAHRFTYALYQGRLDSSLVMDHLCRVRHCVNPRHLEQVTMRENYLRGHHWAVLGLCKRGHVMTSQNTYTYQSGARGEMRTCLICRMVSRRRWCEKQTRFRQAVPLEIRRLIRREA